MGFLQPEKPPKQPMGFPRRFTCKSPYRSVLLTSTPDMPEGSTHTRVNGVRSWTPWKFNSNFAPENYAG